MSRGSVSRTLAWERSGSALSLHWLVSERLVPDLLLTSRECRRWWALVLPWLQKHTGAGTVRVQGRRGPGQPLLGAGERRGAYDPVRCCVAISKSSLPAKQKRNFTALVSCSE